MKTKKTQIEVVLDMLQTDQLVSCTNAYKVTKQVTGVGTMRLASIIYRLKDRGYKIATHTVISKNGNYAIYELVNKPVNKNKKKVSKASK
jgi:hypothetical protein